MATITDGLEIGKDYVQPFSITVNTVGITEIIQTLNLIVYPNPTTGELRIENGELKIENVAIYDVMGRLLQSKIVNQKSKIELDISHLSSGIYFLRIDEKTVKVVKQ